MRFAGKALLCAAVVPLMSMAGAAFAQNYPTKAVRLIVPFPAGGPADMFARELGQGMSAQWKRPVLIENKGGAGGTFGVDQSAKAEPDGYTLTLNSGSAVAIAPFAQSNMPYDPLKDLALITTVVKVPEVMVVNPSIPANNLKELIAYLKANPGKVSFGSAGGGTITHLAGELLKTEAKVDMLHVPYKGAAPAVTDLLGNQVQLVVLDVPVVLPHIQAGKIKAIVVTSGSRASALPDVPSTAESGFPKVNSDNWYGLVGAAKIPQPVLDRIHAAAMVTLKSPGVREQFAKFSAVPIPSTPQEYRKFVIAEQAKWGAIVKAIGFKEETGR
jgi:tripartite-type tricarboxylate transporter receptor subunit TctC